MDVGSMEGTQRSTMSTTQPISQSAYLSDQGGIPIPPSIQRGSPSMAHINQEAEAPHTESTPYTYQEGDTGHIDLQIDHASLPPVPEDDEPSQDEAYDVVPIESSSSQAPLPAPHTPAQPVNPFTNRGTVLKGVEMFGATQPSSVGPQLASPTSSRPSPDIYNNFQTPCIDRMLSSSLVGFGNNVDEIPGPPMFRSMFEQPTPRPGTSSIPPGLQRMSSLPEPKRYNSMKHSQERRKQMEESFSNSSDDSDIEAELTMRKNKRDQELQAELSSFRLKSRIPKISGGPTSSGVEVPSTSTKRRRNKQDDYIALCDCHDARGTQPKDDIIADSQTLPEPRMTISSPPRPSSRLQPLQEDPENVEPTSLTQSASESSHPVENQSTEEHVEMRGCPEVESTHRQEPALPLQELSPNRASGKPASSNKTLTSSRQAVPETSPVRESSLRGIADGEDEEELEEPPLFMQDEEMGDVLEMPPPVAERSGPRPTAISDITSTAPQRVSPRDRKQTLKAKKTCSTKTNLHQMQPPKQLSTESDMITSSAMIPDSTEAEATVEATITLPVTSSVVQPASSPVSTSSAPSPISFSRVATPRSTPVDKTTTSSTRTSITRSSKSVKMAEDETPVHQATHKTKRKSLATRSIEEPIRASKRQSLARLSRDSSLDPLALPAAPIAVVNPISKLFTGMAFAVSYKEAEKERDAVIKHIKDNGADLLDAGFDSLFTDGSKTHARVEKELVVAKNKRAMGFVALIADDYSRKPKYVQALALGLPCLSGHWILASVKKGSLLDWKPYLLCAGQSVWGTARVSRHLTYHPAAEANLLSTFSERTKILEGKSILAVAAKRGTDEKTKTFMFFVQASSPARFARVASFTEARNRLLDDQKQGVGWDLVYSDANANTVESVIFSVAGGGARKRKRDSTAATTNVDLPPKKVRVICGEKLLQSLILGQLLDD
ncbi:hypothetical protein BJ875DRAFT_470729 [Amylocarpus encephaloides]|uniref:BRCT domain-containing protein n=1 Tax=Amylocarpus encephaloides TaxID=45428 RepID=A0A9P7YDF4_9HELO|nr:hypothetical protein BJ875DRAFT_470729 [Amylocarpus encephaloides]